MSIVVTELPDVGITVLSRWIFNCYVVHNGGDGRPLVVDPGIPSVTRAAIAALGARPPRYYRSGTAHFDDVCASIVRALPAVSNVPTRSGEAGSLTSKTRTPRRSAR